MTGTKPDTTCESTLFGRVRVATDAERGEIERLARECPQEMMSALSRALNKRGFLFVVEALDS